MYTRELIQSVQKGDLKEVKDLVKKGANIFTTDEKIKSHSYTMRHGVINQK